MGGTRLVSTNDLADHACRWRNKPSRLSPGEPRGGGTISPIVRVDIVRDGSATPTRTMSLSVKDSRESDAFLEMDLIDSYNAD